MKKLFAITIVTISIASSALFAGDFGESFGGAFLGSTASNILTRDVGRRPRHHGSQKVDQLRMDHNDLYDLFLQLRRKVMDHEDEIRRLKKQVLDLESRR